MKVLLLGDSCEDEYIYGRCNRISPEAPVPVLDYAKIKTTSGMAGNVCLNLQSFGLDITFLTNNEQLVGVGAGQMSRVDSVKIGIMKAKNNGLKLDGCVMSSDAFFPFPDSIEIAHKAGVAGVIQPGGSIKDEEIIEKANQLGISMVFTSERHFYH